MQFHPEVSHTPHGQKVLRRFLEDGAGIAPTWTPLNVIEDLVERIRTQVGDRPVLCGLSGGVDSSVAAALVHRAVGDQLTCVFVDHGLMRHDEGAQVEATFRDHFHVDLVHVQAQDQFPRRRSPASPTPSRSARSSASSSSEPSRSPPARSTRTAPAPSSWSRARCTRT